MANLLELLSVPIVDENKNATPYFEDAWYQLIQAIGGEGAAPVNDTTNKTISLPQNTDKLHNTYTHSISSNYTCLNGIDEFIQISASCTVTLNSLPNFGEEKWFQPTGYFVVTISGKINSESSVIMNGAYDLMHLTYTELGWVIV